MPDTLFAKNDKSGANFAGTRRHGFCIPSGTNELQSDHTPGYQSAGQWQPRPSRHREAPPQARLDLCLVQSVQSPCRPSTCRAGERQHQKIQEKIHLGRDGPCGRLPDRFCGTVPYPTTSQPPWPAQGGCVFSGFAPVCQFTALVLNKPRLDELLLERSLACAYP